MPKLAVLGGLKLRTKPFTKWPIYSNKEIKNIIKVIKSKNWGGYPEPNTLAKEFAKKFAKYHTAKFGVCAVNGSITLEIALRAAEIKSGDEVIVPAYTWVATGAAPININAITIFADICEDTFTIDPLSVKKLITKKTRAIICVHLGMNICDLDELKKIALKHNLILIEDCAHAHGGVWKNKGVGSVGDFGSFSFQTSKLMTAGEGGIVITSNEEYAEKLHSLVNCGRPSETDKFKNRLYGYNYRITEFQTAILLAQLSRLKSQTEKREKAIKYFEEKLKKIEGITLLKRDNRITKRGAYMYIFKYQEEYFENVSRDAFVFALNAEGIPAEGLFYEPVYESPLFIIDEEKHPVLKANKINYKNVHCPVTERAAYKQSVWIPHQVFLGSNKDIDDLISAIIKIKENIKELKDAILKGKVQDKAESRTTRGKGKS